MNRKQLAEIKGGDTWIITRECSTGTYRIQTNDDSYAQWHINLWSGAGCSVTYQRMPVFDPSLQDPGGGTI